MSYSIYWMPYSPSSGAEIAWEVTVRPSESISGSDDPHAHSECLMFATEAKARAFLAELAVSTGTRQGAVTVRAVSLH